MSEQSRAEKLIINNATRVHVRAVPELLHKLVMEHFGLDPDEWWFHCYKDGNSRIAIEDIEFIMFERNLPKEENA